MRIIVMGTGDFAVPSFRRLLKSEEHEILMLITMPFRGARSAHTVSKMRTLAEKHGIPIYDPDNINTQESADLIYLYAADLLFVCDYGRILSQQILKSTRMGGLNLHGSLLPKFRGAAPVSRAVLQGETQTGISIIHMIPAVDAGPIVAKSPVIDILPNETAIQLEHRLAEIGEFYLVHTLRQMETGRLPALPQKVEDITRAPKLRKEEAFFDWNWDAATIHNHVRGMIPWPKSMTFWQKLDSNKAPLRVIVGEVRVLQEDPAPELQPQAPGTVVRARGNELVVATGKHWIHILKIQCPGKAMLDAASFINGYRIRPGDRFVKIEPDQ